jgi:membrane protein DedA with SNARE-associated domain
VISDITPATLLVLWGVVAFGSIIPVVPTGAAVSGAAVLAGHDEPLEIVLVVLVGAAGAYAGDLVTYGALSAAGTPLARRLGWLDDGDEDTVAARLHHLREGIERHELRTLIISRLVPAGRIPVLLVASLTGYPWLKFVTAAIGSCLLWALLYSAVGVLGDAVFDSQTTAIIVVMVAAVVLSVVPGLVRRLWSRRSGGAGAQ